MRVQVYAVIVFVWQLAHKSIIFGDYSFEILKLKDLMPCFEEYQIEEKAQ